MAFSAVFAYYDLICLKLSILFLALSNVKTKLFILENGKIFLEQSGHKIRFRCLDFEILFECLYVFKNSKIAAKLARDLVYKSSFLFLRFRAICRAITSVQLTQQMPSVTF